MPNPQRFLRVAIENALDLAGQGTKDPGELHFNAQSIVQDVNLRCRGLSKSHDPQIRCHVDSFSLLRVRDQPGYRERVCPFPEIGTPGEGRVTGIIFAR
jgi:hypothetical protein